MKRQGMTRMDRDHMRWLGGLNLGTLTFICLDITLINTGILFLHGFFQDFLTQAPFDPPTA